MTITKNVNIYTVYGELGTVFETVSGGFFRVITRDQVDHDDLPVPELSRGRNLLKRFQKRFPAHLKQFVKTNEIQSIISNKFNQFPIYQEKTNHGLRLRTGVIKNSKKTAAKGKLLKFFLLDTLKTTF